jgi:hypothetical protein
VLDESLFHSPIGSPELQRPDSASSDLGPTSHTTPPTPASPISSSPHSLSYISSGRTSEEYPTLLDQSTPIANVSTPASPSIHPPFLFLGGKKC